MKRKHFALRFLQLATLHAQTRNATLKLELSFDISFAFDSNLE